MTTRADLGDLEANGLIQIAAVEPELEYLFRHALVQEAAYSSLLKQDRRALHRLAAEAIIALHPDRQPELAGVIALHYEQAGDAPRAAEQLVVAGQHALERFAHWEAVGFFARAGALADQTQGEVKLRAAVGGAKAGWAYTQPGTDIDLLEQAVSGAAPSDPGLLTEAYFWIAFLRRQRGELPESSPQLKHALERGAELGRLLADPEAVALPRALMGSYVAFTGDLREGAREMREALEQVEAKGDSLSTAIISDYLALTYARLGEFEAAERTIARSHNFAASGDHIARVDADIAEAGLHLERGETEKARAQALACASRSEDLGAYACVVASNVMYGAASLAREDPRAAKGPLERGRELCRVTNMAPMETLTHALLGSARAQLGDFPGGVAGWDAALAGARAMHDRYGEAQTLWGRARSFARQAATDPSAAMVDLDRAIELFERMGARPSLARALNDRALALRSLNRAGEAATDERRAMELGREIGLRDAPFA
ncbi:MAG TPA: hypothetical protein VLK30_07895 [Candidatus Limnocylindrales bacterium]|nr:hypothetical protein [Candidatus Limnocylindrales bacterium]